MAVSRREFIKAGFAAVGAALGGFGLARDLFAGGIPERESGQGLPAPADGLPRYIGLERSGELARREQALWALYDPCRLCPRLCGANRSAGRAGICSAASSLRVASFGPDFGNERAIAGTRGSGSIFVSNCNLLCVFCQNWQIAHRGDGTRTSHQELANMLLNMQRRGCHNVSFITPTHMVPHLISGLRLAIAGGLNVPLCYNTSGYDSLEVIQLLDGIVDIYQPDFKFQSAEHSARFASAPDYPVHAAAAIKEMVRQVGFLQVGQDGLARRGVVVRHLLMPENIAGTDVFVRWVVSELGSDAHVNIMNQYWPAHRAIDFPPIDRRITPEEAAQAMRWAREAGLRHFH